MNRFNLFRFRDAWPWFLVNGLAAAAFIKFLTFEPTLLGGLLLGAVLATFLGISVFRFVCRWRFLETIRGFTRGGTAVAFLREDAIELYRRFVGTDYLGYIQGAITAAVVKVSARYPEVHAADYAKAFNGLIIVFGTKKIEVHGMAKGAFGTAGLDQINIGWDWDHMAKDEATLFRLIRHEAGHICLMVAGVKDWKHHEIMKALGV
jgi:hypothetical protein